MKYTILALLVLLFPLPEICTSGLGTCRSGLKPSRIQGAVPLVGPEQVPGLTFWLRADTEVFAEEDGTGAVADGEDVGFWGDTITGHDVVQAGATERPSWVEDAMNGEPGLSFDGVDEYLSSAAFDQTGGTDGTWFVAMIFGDAYNSNVLSTYLQNLAVIKSGGGPYVYHSSTQYRYIALGYKNAQGMLIIGGYDSTGAGNDDRAFMRLNAERFPKPRAGVAIDTDQTTELDGLWVGRNYSSGGFMKDTLMEVAFWPRVLTEAEMLALEVYAHDRYFQRSLTQVVVVGDSLSKGYPVTTGALSFPNKLEALWGTSYYDVYNASIIAYAISDLEPTGNSWTNTFQNDWNVRNVVIHQGGTNDFDPNTKNKDAATSIADMTTSVANRQAQGAYVFVCTVPKRGDLAEPDATTFEGRRVAYNTAILAGDTGADGILDWAGLPELSDPEDLTYFYSDKLHFTEAMNDVLAAQAKAAIDAVTPKP